MVDVPKVSFFSAEGGLLLEAHKLRNLDARFRAAKEELGKCTVQELRRLESEEFKKGRETQELREFLARFKNNFYALLRAYTEVVQEIDRILNLISQSEYEDLLSLKQVMDKVVAALEDHKDWFVYDSDVLSDYKKDFMATVIDLNKKLVDEYSLKQTVGAHGKSTLLRLRAFLKSRGFIERYAEGKAMRAGRVYRRAKKKAEAVEEKIRSGENFLPALHDYLHLLDDLNQLLHILALDILTVFMKFEKELNVTIPILMEFIKQILNPQLRAEMQAKHREFLDEYMVLRRKLQNPQWANVSTTLGKTAYDEAWELMGILSSRSREGPRTRGARIAKENKERKQRDKKEKQRLKREARERKRKARAEALKKRKEALANNLKKKWWRVRHVSKSTVEGLKEGWVEGGKKQEQKRDERKRARDEAKRLKDEAREKARVRQEELQKGVQPTPGPKMNLLRSKEVRERMAKQGAKIVRRREREEKINALKKKFKSKWWKFKHVTSSTAEGLREGWVEGGRKQEQKKDEKKRAKDEAKRLKEEGKAREKEAAEEKKKQEDQAKAQAREQARQERQKTIDSIKKRLAGKWWKIGHVTKSTAEGLKEGWVEGGRKQEQKKDEKKRAREEAKRLKKEEKQQKQRAAEEKKKQEDAANAQAREEQERVRDQARLAAAERWRVRKEKVARLFRRSPKDSGTTPAEISAAELARRAREQAGERTQRVRMRLPPRRKRK